MKTEDVHPLRFTQAAFLHLPAIYGIEIEKVTEEVVRASIEVRSKYGSLDGFSASVSIISLILLNFNQEYFYPRYPGTSTLRPCTFLFSLEVAMDMMLQLLSSCFIEYR